MLKIPIDLTVTVGDYVAIILHGAPRLTALDKQATIGVQSGQRSDPRILGKRRIYACRMVNQP
jgi:hypothetical protein